MRSDAKKMKAKQTSGKEEGHSKEVKRSRGWETPGRDGRTDAIADDDHSDDDDTEDVNDVQRGRR